MKIHLERSGGFAGMTGLTTVDSKALAPNDANKLQKLIHKSNIFERSASPAHQPKSKQSYSQYPSPDTKTKTKKVQPITLHTKSLQNGNREQSMECNDINMQADVKELVDFVTKQDKSNSRFLNPDIFYSH